MVRWGHHLCLTDTLHFKIIIPYKTTVSIIIKCRGILLFQFIISPDPKNHVRFCHHLVSVICLSFVSFSHFLFYFQTTVPIGTKLYLKDVYKVLYRNFSFPFDRTNQDRKIFEVMTSTLPKGTLGSVASLLTATLYQGNPDRNHKLWKTHGCLSSLI